MTDQNGRFRLDRVEPGDYYLEVRPPLLAAIGEPKPVEDFRNAVQKTYTSTWHPGMERLELALPVKLVEGAAVEGVQVEVTKKRTASVRGRLLSDLTGEVRLSLTAVQNRVGSRGYMVIARGTRNAGAEFEIDDLSPGAYHLFAEMPGLTGSERRWASMTLEVGEQNQDGVDLQLREGVAITGFQLPTSRAPRMKPSSISVSRAKPRHMTVFPGGGSFARAR